MRRSNGVLLTFMSCAACGEGASLAARPRAVVPAPTARAPELPLLATLSRSERPGQPVRILEPREGAEIDAAAAQALVVRVERPVFAASPNTLLELSLDGARPRPVAGGTLGIAELTRKGAVLSAGAHDLVLAAVGADGVVLAPSAGGVMSVRFFVGSRVASAPPRVVCLAPFGTYYGSAPRIVLDFVVVAGMPTDIDVAIESGGSSRRARAVGGGPFALGNFASGDHELTLTAVGGALGTLPGHCGFAYNRELELPP